MSRAAGWPPPSLLGGGGGGSSPACSPFLTFFPTIQPAQKGLCWIFFLSLLSDALRTTLNSPCPLAGGGYRGAGQGTSSPPGCALPRSPGSSLPCAPREHTRVHTRTLGALCRQRGGPEASPQALRHSSAIRWELLISLGVNAAHSWGGAGGVCGMRLSRCERGKHAPAGSAWDQPLWSCPLCRLFIAQRLQEISCLSAPTPSPFPLCMRK